MTISVRLRGLEKRFAGVVAVRSIDLDIEEGSFFSIIGPSGCGKSTTLRMIAGLEHPTSGRIDVGDRDITDMPAHRRPVNMVFQSYALFPHLDVYGNIAFGLVEDRLPRQEIRGRVREMIELVRLEGRERSHPRQLSGGQQQRVALARALIKHPKVLLLDEPLGALDLKLRQQLEAELKDVQRRVGITFVYVTHDQEEAFSMSDAVAVMNGGVLEQVGMPEDVYRRPETLFVADFVGRANLIRGRVVDAAGGERYTVKIAGGNRIAATGRHGLAPETDVRVIVRPEEVRLHDATQPVDLGFNAVVTDIAYLGPTRTVRLHADLVGDLVATLHGPVRRLRSGERVGVSWAPEAAWIVTGPDGAGG